jgi:hypothetical protein
MQFRPSDGKLMDFPQPVFTPIRQSIQAMRNASREMEPSLIIVGFPNVVFVSL